MSTVAQRVAARHLQAEGRFSVGDEVRYGKYKNMRGKIVRFFEDERGVPSVEIEPVPRGRKQNKTMGLYKIWQARTATEHAGDVFISPGGPDLLPVEVVGREAEAVTVRDVSLAAVLEGRDTVCTVRPEELRTAARKQACIVFSKKCDGNVILGKVRDRMYDPEICIYHMEVGGTEMCVMFDRVTGFCEGVNEHGIGIVNSTLMVLQDEREGVADGDAEPERSPDGVKIIKALTYDKIGDVLQSLVLHKPKKFKRGLKGHTLVSDGDQVVALENTRIHPPKPMRLDADKVHTRTNHGIYYPGAGYTQGPDYISSIVRRWEAQKQLEKAQHAEDLMPSLTRPIGKVPSAFNPMRFTDKMRTTSQMAVDPKNREVRLYLVPGHSDFKGIRNLLPGGRKPKIKTKIFKYPSVEKLRERAITVPEEMPEEGARREPAEPAGMPERVAARYKSKKTVKTKDGDEMTVYEYSDRQVADRNRGKAERIEKLRKSMDRLRTRVRRDVKSADEKARDAAAAVALMDETFERVGNPESAKEGHFGVTTWRVKQITFGKGGATIRYVGKSGVDQKKKISAALASVLRKIVADKKPGDCALSVSAADVNAYLKPFGISAKDIRGFHANTTMKEELRKARRGRLPEDPKEREKKLKDEFDAALEAAAERVGHEPSTLKSQYLVPGLEDAYKKDGTVNESHTRKTAAEAVTDTASFYVIAPEALKGMLDDTSWLELAHAMWPGAGTPGTDTWDQMRDLVLDSGGAFIGTGSDGGFDVDVVGQYVDGVLQPYDGPVVQRGARPPYGLRQAARQGTPTERRILANAVHAPVLVARPRSWWLREAPHLYRLARAHERPRPEIEGMRFDPQMFSVLWYEDDDGNRIDDDLPEDAGVPEGARYQLSQFPNVLHDSMLQLNDDGTSSEILRGSRGFPDDVVTAMVRSDEWDVSDAIMVAAQSCERCLNVLAHAYGLEGYAYGSEPYWQAGTRCRMCDHVGSGHGREATKTDAEVEDEKVQKMLRKEPKKKPPRYDLRDNRTLDEEDEDLEGMGGGDRGDRDLSLKWNKVSRRVAFRWLAVPHGLSGARVALMHRAKGEGESEFKKEMQGKKFRHPETGNEVSFVSLPSEEQKKIYDRWKASRGPAEDEGGAKKEKKEEEARDPEQISKDLDEARQKLHDIQDEIDELKGKREDHVAGTKAVKEVIRNLPDSTSPERRQEIKDRLKDERRKIHEYDDQIAEKKGDLEAQQDVVDGLKAERDDPTGAKRKRKQEEKKKQREHVQKAMLRARKTMERLVGKDSDLPKSVRERLADQLDELDPEEVEEFSTSFQDDLEKMLKLDLTSQEAADIANGAARSGFSTEGASDPRSLAQRVAQITWARNVAANPLIAGGTPFGTTDMSDDAAYGKRAYEAFQQFQDLHPSLRLEAARKIQEKVKDLPEDHPDMQEYNALLVGIDTAQIADTGEATPGRQQPSRGAAALIKRMVETGGAAQMFRPVEDMFADDSRKAMRSALEAMDRDEAADWLIGDDRDHPFAELKEHVKGGHGVDEYSEFVQQFLIEDFMADVWGDRAARDVMEAAGMQDWDDPAVRAKALEDAKRVNAPERHKALAAMDRIRAAKEAGEDPDPADVEAAALFSPDKPKGVVQNIRALLTSLKEKAGGKNIVTPATAVLENFAETGDPSVLEGETVPHADAEAPEPRPKAEREQARAEQETLRKLEQRHGPTDGAEEPKRTEEERVTDETMLSPGALARMEKGWRAMSLDGEARTFADRQQALDYSKSKAKGPKGPGREPGRPQEGDEDRRKKGETWQTKKGWYGKAQDGKVYGPYNSQEEARRGIRGQPLKGEKRPVKPVPVPKETDEGFSADFSVPTPERGPTRFAHARVASRRLAAMRSQQLAASWLAHVRSVHPDDPDRPVIVLGTA